jgi:hypothetical protein
MPKWCAELLAVFFFFFGDAILAGVFKLIGRPIQYAGSAIQAFGRRTSNKRARAAKKEKHGSGVVPARVPRGRGSEPAGAPIPGCKKAGISRDQKVRRAGRARPRPEELR